jgi:hypothetical protein
VRWLGILALCACGRINFDPTRGADAGDSGISAEQLGQGLLLYFDFESNDPAIGVVGAATCTACPLEVSGKVGTYGGQFFAGGTCMQIADTPALRPPLFTFALWVNASGPQLATTFGRPYMGATAQNNTWEMYTDTQGVWFVGGNRMYTGSVVSANTWHHVAGVFDGMHMLRYIDGAYTTTVTMGPVVYGNDDVLVGCDIGSGTQGDFFDGVLDEIRLYDRMLSEAEIAALAAL